MQKKLILTVLVMMLALGAATVVCAAEEEAAKGPPSGAGMAIPIGAGVGIAIAAFGGALGQGRGLAAAVEGIARNPGASGKIITPMIIGLAMIESLVIYSLLVSLLLVFKI